MGARGDGSVERLPSGRFRAVVSLGTDGTGRRIRKSRTFATRKAANTWKREQLTLYGEGRLGSPGRTTLAEWLDRWLAGKVSEVEAGTYQGYETYIRLHLKPRLGHLLLRDLRPVHLRSFADQLVEEDLGGTLRRYILVALRQVLKDAVRAGLLTTDPSAGLKLPRARRPDIVCWTAEQARAFLAACTGQRHHALFALALDSGMRQGEILGLHWSEVDLVAGTVLVCRSLERRQHGYRLKPPKSAAGRRRLTLARSTCALLAEHRRQQEQAGHDVVRGPVFTNRQGGWLDPQPLRKQHFFPTIQRAGVPRIRFHDLRHTCATLLLLAGVNIKAVSVRLGHASVTVTLNTYSHYLPEMDEQISRAVQEALYTPVLTVRPTEGDSGTGA